MPRSRASPIAVVHGSGWRAGTQTVVRLGWTGRPHGGYWSTMDRDVTIRIGAASLAGNLVIPASAAREEVAASRGVVVFAHGSGSSRHSPRNRAVAGALQQEGLGTLLLDLLTPNEEVIDSRTGELRFDVELLAARLVGTVDQVAEWDETRARAIGLFGASTGAAGALLAAAERPNLVRAVVSRGGRPDLAGDRLSAVRAPTMLIVGGADPDVLALNRDAERRMSGAVTELRVVPGAGHLFGEPGALEQVSALAAEWFRARL